VFGVLPAAVNQGGGKEHDDAGSVHYSVKKSHGMTTCLP